MQSGCAARAAQTESRLVLGQQGTEHLGRVSVMITSSVTEVGVDGALSGMIAAIGVGLCGQVKPACSEQRRADVDIWKEQNVSWRDGIGNFILDHGVEVGRVQGEGDCKIDSPQGTVVENLELLRLTDAHGTIGAKYAVSQAGGD